MREESDWRIQKHPSYEKSWLKKIQTIRRRELIENDPS